MSGYWQRPEETAQTLHAGWLHTGDVGRIDDDGYLFVEDRIKDLVVSGGENVYPQDVEDVLREHPAVAEAAVIGVPDERWGEAVKAVVALRPGAHLHAGGDPRVLPAPPGVASSGRARSTSSTRCPAPRPGRSSSGSCASPTGRAADRRVSGA